MTSPKKKLLHYGYGILSIYSLLFLAEVDAIAMRTVKSVEQDILVQAPAAKQQFVRKREIVFQQVIILTL